MAAVLEVTQAERPALAFIVARLLPMMGRGTTEQQEVAERLVYLSRGLDEAPAGPGEVELLVEDLYHLGVRVAAVSADLEEYWLDRLAEARGGSAAEPTDPEVAIAARRYFPEIDKNPQAWDFRSVQPAFLDLGFKLDRLITQASPQVRGLYNKERTLIASTAAARRVANAEKRGLGLGAVSAPALPVMAGARAGQGAHGATETAPRSRPVGTAVTPTRGPRPGLSVVARATFPGPYEWGVETGTGVNVDELEPDRPRKVNVGGTELMLVNTEGKVCAVTRTCPHRGWDLSRGEVVDGVITCTLHGAQFNACTGAVLREPFDPAFNKSHALMGGLMSGLDPKHTTAPIESYPTSIAEDGEVRVHI